MGSNKDVVRNSVKVPDFDQHLKKAGGHIGRNVVEITTKMKTIVQKPLIINFFNEFELLMGGMVNWFQVLLCLYLYCYFHNVSADVSSGLLQVFFVELGTSNLVLYLIDEDRLL